jgi:hypothetical protein
MSCAYSHLPDNARHNGIILSLLKDDFLDRLGMQSWFDKLTMIAPETL